MKKLMLVAASLAAVSLVNHAYCQASPASSPAAGGKRTEVYSVTFSHAAAGKVGALEEWAKKSAGASGDDHTFVLRHEAGAPWDYVTITHIGAKATVEASGNPRGPELRPLLDWHDDTFVNGPSWTEFARAMDLDEKTGKAKSAESVYVVSVYRPNTGQEDALEKFLSEPPQSGDLTAGDVLLQHLEGGAWRFLGISRYKNYQDYAASEAKAVAQTAKGGSSWFRLRELVSFHNDTVTNPVMMP